MRHGGQIPCVVLLTAALVFSGPGCWSGDWRWFDFGDDCGDFDCSGLCHYLIHECGQYTYRVTEYHEKCEKECGNAGLSQSCREDLCDLSCGKLDEEDNPIAKVCDSSCEEGTTSCEFGNMKTCSAGVEVTVSCHCACLARGWRYVGSCGAVANLEQLGGEGLATADRDMCWCTPNVEQGDWLHTYFETVEECFPNHALYDLAEGFDDGPCPLFGNPGFLGHSVSIGSVTSDVGLEEFVLPELPVEPQSPPVCPKPWPSGDCSIGEGAGFKYVMVEDSPDNPTLIECNTNPGADIDSVCVYRANELMDCAAEVSYTTPEPVPCEVNKKDDPEQVLGLPDGLAGPDDYEGYFSLNGGWIILGFEYGFEFLCGDVIHVIEMHNEEDPDATVEQYRTSIGEGTDCLQEGHDCRWSLESDWAVGEDEIDLTWVW